MTIRIRVSSTCLLLTFLASPQVGLAADRASDPRVSAIYETLRMSLDRIQAIEYTASFDRTQHIELGSDANRDSTKPSTIHYDLEYTLDGNLFRSRTRYKRSEDGAFYDQQSAYDGQAYQVLKGEKGLLTLSATPPDEGPMQSGMLQPLVVPFRFVFGRDIPLDFERLHSDQPWNDVARASTLGDRQEIAGHECEEVLIDTFNQTSARTKWKVYLAEDLEYFPIRLEADLVMNNFQLHNEIVVQAEVVDSPVAKVVIPTHIKHVTYRSGELILTQEFEIDPESLRVNHAVDLGAFTIAQEQALGGVFDKDRGVFVRLPEDELAAYGSADEGVGWPLITANLTFLVVTSVFVYVYRKRRLGQQV